MTDDLRLLLGLDGKAFEAGLNKARADAQKWASQTEQTSKRAATGFSGAFKSGFGQAAFAVQDFATVMGQGGSNSLGRAMMSASNNIGMLGASFGPMGMVVATGAAVLASTLLPAVLNAMNATANLTEKINEFVEASRNAGKNRDFGVGLERQLAAIMRSGGAGLQDFRRGLSEKVEDITDDMNRLKTEFRGTDQLADATKKIRDRMTSEVPIPSGSDLSRGRLAKTKKEFDEEMKLYWARREFMEKEKKNLDIFRMDPKVFQDKALAAGVGQEEIDKLMALRKEWIALNDELRKIQELKNKIRNQPVIIEDVPAMLRESTEATRAEIAHFNRGGSVAIPTVVAQDVARRHGVRNPFGPIPDNPFGAGREDRQQEIIEELRKMNRTLEFNRDRRFDFPFDRVVDVP